MKKESGLSIQIRAERRKLRWGISKSAKDDFDSATYDGYPFEVQESKLLFTKFQVARYLLEKEESDLVAILFCKHLTKIDIASDWNTADSRLLSWNIGRRMYFSRIDSPHIDRFWREVSTKVPELLNEKELDYLIKNDFPRAKHAKVLLHSIAAFGLRETGSLLATFVSMSVRGYP